MRRASSASSSSRWRPSPAAASVLLLGQGLPKHPRYDLSRRRALAGDHSASWAPRVEVCGPEAASLGQARQSQRNAIASVATH